MHKDRVLFLCSLTGGRRKILRKSIVILYKKSI